MLADVFINDLEINFAPSTLAEEILQNVKTICSTLKGSIPLDREFGIDTALIDEPVNVARAKLSAQYIDAIRKFEPRADVVRVYFRDAPESAEVLPVVSVRLRD